MFTRQAIKPFLGMLLTSLWLVGLSAVSLGRGDKTPKASDDPHEKKARLEGKIYDKKGGDKRPPDRTITALAIGRTEIVTAGADKVLRFWDRRTGKMTTSFAPPVASVDMLSLSPAGNYLATSTWGSAIQVWYRSTLQLAANLPLPKGCGIRCLCWGGKGGLISGDNGGMVRVWDLKDARQRRAFRAYELAVVSLELLDDNTLLTSGSRSTSLKPAPGVTFLTSYEDYFKVWNLEDGKLCRQLPWAGMEPVDSLYADLCMAYERRIKADKDSTEIGLPFVLRNRHSRAELRAVDGGFIKANAYLLVMVDYKKRLHVIDIFTGKPIHHEPDWNVTPFNVSDDCELIVGGTKEGTLRICRFPFVGRGGRDNARSRAQLWKDLTADDPKSSWQALSALRATPAETLKEIKALVSPKTAQVESARLRAWLKDLDSSKFRTRDEASQMLKKHVVEAAPLLRGAVERMEASAETVKRIQAILKTPRMAYPLTGQALREGRCLQLLSLIDHPDARSLLRSLASGVPDHPLTAEARRLYQARRR